MAGSSWIAGGIVARLLMIAFLLMSVRVFIVNHTDLVYDTDVYKLQSHTYTIVAGIVGLAASLMQMPVSLYLLCRSKSTIPTSIVLDTSMFADTVTSLVLASGVGAGFGATDDVLRYVRTITDWPPSAQQDFIRYYNRMSIANVFLLVGMLLSVCATVVSARLRTRAEHYGREEKASHKFETTAI